MARRLVIVKADGSVLVHADGGSYKPLNWMSPPCTLVEGVDTEGRLEWMVEARGGDTLRIVIEDVLSDSTYDLGIDPGLEKDGVERHLQELLADHPSTLSEGMRLVRREFPTAIGPVDLLCREVTRFTDIPLKGSHWDGGRTQPPGAAHVAVEIKRKAGIDAVEQLSRYLELLNRDPLLAPVRGALAAQVITAQARTLARDRDIECYVVDYDELRGLADPTARLF